MKWASKREWLASVGAVVVVLGIALSSHAGKSDCYTTDIGKPGDPWLVLVSDTTTDGLCHD